MREDHFNFGMEKAVSALGFRDGWIWGKQEQLNLLFDS